MKLQQLSIFAENKNGALYNITQLLKKANIDIHAFSVADTANFGVLRLIVSDIRGACRVLSEADIVVNRGRRRRDPGCAGRTVGRAGGAFLQQHRRGIHVCVCLAAVEGKSVRGAACPEQ